MDEDFELMRDEVPMEVWAEPEEGYVAVNFPEDGGVKEYPIERAREMANAFETYAENHGENNDELYQAAMLKRCADRVEQANSVE